MKASRSYKKVAEQIGVSERNVGEWGKVFKWQDRVKERDKKIAEGVAEKVIEKEIDLKTSIYKAIQVSVDKYTKNLLDGKANVETVKDLDILGRLWKELEIQVETVNSQTEVVNGFSFDINGEPNED